MGYIRMTPANMVHVAGNRQIKNYDLLNTHANAGSKYLFCNGKWQAMAYLSDRLLIEDGRIDPRQVFPVRAYTAMTYGEAWGIYVNTIQYRNEDGEKIGAIAEVHREKISLGFYATRYENGI